jgi:glycosyltransferase involved in cell wall biosynthesis
VVHFAFGAKSSKVHTKMNIAMVNISMKSGRGSDIVLMNLAQQLSISHSVTIFSLMGSDLRPDKCEIVDYYASDSRDLRCIAKTVRELWRRKDEFDVINCHHALVSLVLPTGRLVTTYHGFRGRLNMDRGGGFGLAISTLVRRFPIRFALRRSQFVSLVSKSLVGEAKAARLINAKVIYNGVETLRTTNQEKLRSSKRSYLLYVGRIDPDKNVERLIDMYVSSKVNFPLLIAGDGVDRTRLESKYVGSDVRFLGNVNREDLPALYEGAVAFVTASVYETFCLPVIEAAQFGCPSIGPASGALPEVICDGKTGFLYADAGFAGAIGKLTTRSSVDQKTMARACQNWADEFTWPNAAAQYETAFRSI